MINWILSSSLLILAMMLLRFLFQGRIRLNIQYALWLLVAVRLLIPFNFGNTVLSFENYTKQETTEAASTTTVSGFSAMAEQDRTGVPKTEPAAPEDPKPVDLSAIPQREPASKRPVTFRFVGYWIWGAGSLLTAFVFLVSNGIFSRKLKTQRKRIISVDSELPVYVTMAIDTPCLYHLLHPAIYLTGDVLKNEKLLVHTVFHETIHYRHRDLWWNLLRCLCLIIHWYNPLVWWAASVSKRDCELACDETAVGRLGEKERSDYGNTLIQLTVRKPKDLFVVSTSMASGKKNLKERIRLLAKKPKMTVWGLIVLTAVLLVITGCTFTKAVEDKERPSLEETPEEETPAKESSLSQKVSNAENIIDSAKKNLRDGYVEAELSYVDPSLVGWDYYKDNPWESDEERDQLAQAAIQELYTLTGYQVTECTYTTDGRSNFIFGKSQEAIRKSTAFYSRDFGFSLCGDAVPYMGFVNARRVHYSDVQQLDSPYQKKEFDGHGAVPAWFLTHSGVYQGEELKGFDTFNLSDTVFTHVRMKFDGGYYEVVSDDSIESAATISGPYYYKDHEREVYASILDDLIDYNILPEMEGAQCDGNVSDQNYSIADVDGDGKRELLIVFGNTNSIAGMRYYIYDFNRISGNPYLELAGAYPEFTVYDNGYIKEALSHNHGRSNLDDFWPYVLYQYDKASDSYKVEAYIDAWQSDLSGSGAPDPDFPKEKDLDGDGVVYYSWSDGLDNFLWIKDNAEYEQWCEQYETGNEQEISWGKIF